MVREEARSLLDRLNSFGNFGLIFIHTACIFSAPVAGGGEVSEDVGAVVEPVGTSPRLSTGLALDPEGRLDRVGAVWVAAL